MNIWTQHQGHAIPNPFGCRCLHAMCTISVFGLSHGSFFVRLGLEVSELIVYLSPKNLATYYACVNVWCTLQQVKKKTETL